MCPPQNCPPKGISRAGNYNIHLLSRSATYLSGGLCLKLGRLAVLPSFSSSIAARRCSVLPISRSHQTIISILSILSISSLFYLYQQPYQLIFSSTRLPLRWRTWRHNRQWWRKGREHSRKNLPSLKNLLPYWIFTWESMREAKVTLSKSCIGLKEMEEGYWSHKAQSISKYAFSGQQPLW